MIESKKSHDSFDQFVAFVLIFKEDKCKNI